MKISKLQLENFRSYKTFSESFGDENIILILGENGKGKTNILEGIFMLSAGKTFRDVDNDDLVKWGMDFFIVKGEIKRNGSGFFPGEKPESDTHADTRADSDERGAKVPTDARCTAADMRCDAADTLSLEVSYANYPRKQKIFKRNDVKITHQDYIGNFVCVLFHPKDLNMLYLEPSLRRKYMNLILSQTDKFYLDALSTYTKVLKQRNALLDEIAEGNLRRDELEIWDEQLAEAGSFMIDKRFKFIDFINKKIQSHYRDISGGNETLEIRYKGEHLDKRSFIKKLVLKVDRDTRYGSTSVGPHLDDIEFILNGREVGQFASRGEFRTILIALKLSEIAYMQNEIKDKPVLLLDDVFSELDESRQEHLFKAIEGYQTFITATDVKKSPFLKGILRKIEVS